MSKARDLANASGGFSTISPAEISYLDGLSGFIQTQIDSKSTSFSQTSEPTYPVDGQIWVDTDGNSPGTSINRWSRVLTTTSTTISGVDNFSATLRYSPGYEQVYFNGVYLTRGTDYTATTGTSIVLTNPPTVGDQLEVISGLQIAIADTYSQTAANSLFALNTNHVVAGKNRLLNGDFSIAQRGTSIAFGGTSLYTLDRWTASGFGSGQPYTVSQQTTLPPAATRHYLQAVTGSSNSTNMYIAQSLETTDVVKLQGKTMTVSFQYKIPTNFTATWAVAAAWGTATNASLRDVGDGTQISNQALTNQTSWTPASYTFTVPATATQLSIMFITYNNVVNGATFQLANVQLEVGSVATAFQTATGTIQGELAACQRYTYIVQGNATNATTIGTGYWNGTTNVVGFLNPKTRMRTTPILTFSSVTDFRVLQVGVSYNNVSAIALATENNADLAQISFTTTGGTNGQASNVIINATATAFIGLVAEL
jgi:hypothetical protein